MTSRAPLSNQEFWEQAASRFEPMLPAVQPDWRVDRPYSPAADVLADMAIPGGPRRYLIYGTVGSGKTTELHWLKQQRQQQDIVVFLDLDTHFQRQLGDPQALENLKSWELLLLIGLAVYGAGQRILSFQWSSESRRELEEAGKALIGGERAASVDLIQLARAVSASVVGPLDLVAPAISAVAEAVRWTLPIGLPDHKALPDQDERAHRLLNAVNRLIAEIQRRGWKLTLILDGLDRLTNPETISAIFVGSAMLGALACRTTIVAAPIALRSLAKTNQVRGFEIRPLENVPVLDQLHPELPESPGPGVRVLADLWRRRTLDLDPEERRLPGPLLTRVAWCSGGRMRDYVKLLRLVAERCYARDLAVADLDVIELVVDRQRRQFEEGIHAGHLSVLREVMDDPHHRLPDNKLVSELVANFWLLPFPNKSTWWYPHPLLTLNMLQPSGG